MSNRMSKKYVRKSLQELNLLDRFLFAKIIEDQDTYEALLQILLEEEIKLLNPPQTEKEFRTSPLLRSIRVDVYSMDEKRTLYNTETQKENTYNLPKRSRYYQGLMDVSSLEPGSTNFNLLNNAVLIMIMPFDLFGEGKYKYTFQMKCEEVDGMDLKDGATRIFFNTRGTNRDEISPELVELLEFIEHTTAKEDILSSNEKIRRIQKQVKLIKSSEEMGVRYMQEWEERAMYVEQERNRIDQLVRFLIEANRTDDLLRSTMDREYQEQLFEEFGL